MDDAIPAGVPPGEAEAARDTFAGAVTASERLEEPIAGELLAGAHDAFAQGFQLAATVSMAVAIVAAAVAAVLLRRVGVDGASPPPPAAGGSLRRGQSPAAWTRQESCDSGGLRRHGAMPEFRRA